jgi:hypothetical protein
MKSPTRKTASPTSRLNIFDALVGMLRARYGTSKGNEPNVHHTKRGPGRMPPKHSPNPAGTKLMRRLQKRRKDAIGKSA